MTSPDNLLGDLLASDTPSGAPAEGFFDSFEIFETNAWKPFEKWDSEVLTREHFAVMLFEMGVAKAHELRATILMKFAQNVASRLGAGSLSVQIGDKTAYTFSGEGGVLTLDYRTSLVGSTQNQQLNAFIGLLVRGIGEHLLNEPGSKVREFMSAIESDFSKFAVDGLGDYVEQNAKIALTDRAISAQIQEEYPGYSQYALDGLYQLQANASQKFFSEATKILSDGKEPDGTVLTREKRKQYELEMASQLLQAETTAPGATYLDAGAYPWALDIEQAGVMYRNISDLEVDHEYAGKGNEIYGKVVERILDLPDEPPQPDPGEDGLPDLSALQDFHTGAEAAIDSAKGSRTAKNSLDNASDIGTDQKVKWDQEKFERIVDQEVEPSNERTPWAEGNPVLSYFKVTAKAGWVAKARYNNLRKAYASEIRKLRNIIENEYTVRMETERGLRSGRPDSTRLVNVRFGRTEVFKRDMPQVDGEPIDIVIITDESGSMGARCVSKGYKQTEKLIDPAGKRNEYTEMAGTAADLNIGAEDNGGTRADVARVFGVMIHEATRGLPGIRVWSYGYTTADPKDYGVSKKTSGGYEGTTIVRALGTPKDPYAIALTLASSGNGDKEALAQALKTLKENDNGARKAIVYLADGGINDSILEQMLRNVQREIPIFFVDMSNDVRGTGGSLKIDHSVQVNSISDAVRGIGRFMTDIVLAA